MRWPTKLALLLVTLLLVNAVTLLAFSEPVASRLAQWRESMLNPQPDRGFLFRTYRSEDGTLHRYAVFVPYEMQVGDRRPLMLFLNGAGKNGDDGVGPLFDGIAPVIWERRREFPFVVVFPQCGEDETWIPEGPATQRALAIADQIAAEFGTDPDRVYLTGLSSGGAGVWNIAAAFPNRFAAIVPISSSGASRDVLMRIAKAGVPVWNFYVRGDGEPLVENNRALHQELLRFGASPCSTELNGTTDARFNTHNAWDFAFRNGALYAWLLRQRRPLDPKCDPFVLLDLNPDETNLRPDDTGRWQLSPDGELVVTPAGSGRWTRCELGSWPLPSHLHLEFRPDAGVRVAIELKTDESADRRLRFIVDSTGWERGGLLDLSSGEAIAAADPVAEASIRTGEWNELRFGLDMQRLTARVNQWTLADCEVPLPGNGGYSLSLLVEGPEGSQVAWRNFRTKPSRRSPPSAPVAAQNTAIAAVVDTGHILDEILHTWRTRSAALERVQIAFRAERLGHYGCSPWQSAFPLVAGARVRPAAVSVDADALHISADFLAPLRRDLRGRFISSANALEFLAMIDDRFDPTGAGITPALLRTSFYPHERVELLSMSEGPSQAVVQHADGGLSREFAQLERLMQLAPLLHCRPFATWAAGIDPARLSVAGTAELAGTECIVLDEAAGEVDPARCRFYVDRTRDDVVVRCLIVDGQVAAQLDIEYAPHAEYRWLPARWTGFVRGATGAAGDVFPGYDHLMAHGAAVVETVEFPDSAEQNAASIEEATPAEFPSGTIVRDEPRDEWYEQRDDGSRRPLSPRELSVILSTDTRPSAGPARRPTQIAILSGIVLLAGLLLFLRIWRRSTDGRRITQAEQS